MGEGFAPLLWGWSVLLLLYLLDRLCRCNAQAGCLGSVLTPLLLLGVLWLPPLGLGLALRWQSALQGSATLQFFGQALRLPLS
jgi:hypothetical protein